MLSSKEKAYCPSWERKKNTSRVRLSDGVRFKTTKITTQTTPRRTTDNTNVEMSAKIKTICIDDDLHCPPKTPLGKRTVAADLSLESNATNWGMVAAGIDELVGNMNWRLVYSGTVPDRFERRQPCSLVVVVEDMNKKEKRKGTSPVERTN